MQTKQVVRNVGLATSHGIYGLTDGRPHNQQATLFYELFWVDCLRSTHEHIMADVIHWRCASSGVFGAWRLVSLRLSLWCKNQNLPLQSLLLPSAAYCIVNVSCWAELADCVNSATRHSTTERLSASLLFLDLSNSVM